MTFQNSSTAFHSRSNEAVFETQDLLFSRTDNKGVIIEASQSFQTLSGFEAEELIGQPHSLVRHSDMPKCVFQLLWARLDQGQTASAYIMNRTKDGRTYWVFTVIAPVTGGFISTQVKPATDLLDKMRDVYRDLLEFERAGAGADADACAEQLEKRLLELGFPSFASFCAQSVVREAAARDTARSERADKGLEAFKSMLTPLQEMQESQVDLMESFEAIRGIPSNMRIVASRLEPAGGPISAISQNYRLMSDEVTTQLSGFYVKGTTDPLPSAALRLVENVMQYGGSRKLVEELKLEKPSGAAAPEGLREDDICVLIQTYKSASRAGLLELCNQVERLARCSKDVRQLVTGLDSIRVLCRVEAGRLGADSAALLPVIDQLDKFHKQIDTTLESISYTAERVSDMTEAVRRNH